LDACARQTALTLADLIPEWIRDEGRRKKVLVENPARLYGF
jgi:predicted TIM-barrel fold metal-dependent hydrolase